MRTWFSGLTFKIAFLIALTEVVILAVVGAIYINRFSSEIDTRILGQLQGLGTLINEGVLDLDIVSDQSTMREIVSEDLIDAYVIGINNGNIFYSLNPAVIGRTVATVDGAPRIADLRKIEGEQVETLIENDQPYTVYIQPIQNQNVPFLYLYMKVGSSQAALQKAEVTNLFVIGSIATIIGTTLIIILSFNFTILTRLGRTVRAVSSVESGQLNTRIARANSSDEIGALQRGVNAMISQLEGLVNNLERRVGERTRDLQIASDVSRRITTMLNEDELLQQIVERTQEGFNLYYAAIFLYDDETKQMVLRQGTGAAGETMKAQDKRFTLDDRGIVPGAAKQREAVIVNDVAQFEEHAFNVLLPDTRSELALPMVIGDQLIGVLDLQAREPDRFGEDDVRVMTTLSEQIGIAVQNARLYTETHRAREAAERAGNVKSAFLASMSHELRTPLNAVINFTKFVARGDLGPVNEQQEETLNEVVGSARHLLSLINDVLDMSKIESGTLALFIEDNVNLKNLLDSVMNTSKSLLVEKRVELRTDIDPELPFIRGDRQRVLQVMLNIMSNACKFTTSGWIELQAHADGDEVIISVQDTGPGIAPEDEALVFEAFKQTDTGLRQVGGTGLGMPISKNLVEAHGGRLWLQSVIGQGTTFFVALPIKSESLTPIFNSFEAVK